VCKYAEVSIQIENLTISKDWTKYSPYTLALWFYGYSENTPANMYIKINDSKVYYPPEEENLQKTEWTRWDIELYQIEIDFKNVSSFSIGLDLSEQHQNAQGIVLFDDIRLYEDVE